MWFLTVGSAIWSSRQMSLLLLPCTSSAKHLALPFGQGEAAKILLIVGRQDGQQVARYSVLHRSQDFGRNIDAAGQHKLKCSNHHRIGCGFRNEALCAQAQGFGDYSRLAGCGKDHDIRVRKNESAAPSRGRDRCHRAAPDRARSRRGRCAILPAPVLARAQRHRTPSACGRTSAKTLRKASRIRAWSSTSSTFMAASVAVPTQHPMPEVPTWRSAGMKQPRQTSQDVWMIQNPSGDSEARLSSSRKRMELARDGLGWSVWHLEPFCGRRWPGRLREPSSGFSISCARRGSKATKGSLPPMHSRSAAQSGAGR